MIAAERNQHPEVIEWLVGLGIDVNAREEDQKTALMMAAEKNRNVEIIKTLIRLGADVNAVEEDGETALMCAAEENSKQQSGYHCRAVGSGRQSRFTGRRRSDRADDCRR